MDIQIETIIKKVVKRAIDLFIQDNSILNIDKEVFQDDFFNNKFGVFIEITDSESSITSLGNIESDVPILDNIIYVLINVIKTLDPEEFERLKNNELTIKIWIVDSFINLKGKTETEKLYGVSVNKPGILINKDNINFYCYLPSVWDEQNDAVYILENLAENANLPKDAWKDSNLDLITFKSVPLIIN